MELTKYLVELQNCALNNGHLPPDYVRLPAELTAPVFYVWNAEITTAPVTCTLVFLINKPYLQQSQV